MFGRLTGRPLPLAGLGLRLAGEAAEAGRGPGEGDGGWGELRETEEGLGGVLRLFLLRPRPIDIRAESDLWNPSRGVEGPRSRGEAV